MFIKQVVIKNIKSIRHLVLDFDTPYQGWHVLLGNNGAGKSTILKAISLCFLGVKDGYALKQNFKSWITKGETEASCILKLVVDEKQDTLTYDLMGKSPEVGIHIDEDGNLSSGLGYTSKKGKQVKKLKFHNGFYSAAFGAYRRLGEEMTKNIANYSDGILENHITLFNPRYNLTSAVQWLKDLKFAQLSNPETSNHFDKIVWFINHSNLLPENVIIEKVNHEGVYFKDDTYPNIEINELSDGYQSIFSLAIEMLRQISKRFDLEEVLKIDEAKNFRIEATGVILIDEVDIHLHPQWQAKVGNWFKTHFPNIQFIISTHSPIICQSAEGGSIWKIEHLKNEKPSREIVGQDFKRMVYGSLSDAISTDVFGEQNIERSQTSSDMLNKLALLNRKAIRGLATEIEKEEIKNLKSILPSGT